MFESLVDDPAALGNRTFDSWERGWRSLLLRRYALPAVAEEITIPPVAEQRITLQLGGEQLIESSMDGPWTAARLAAGVVCITPPRQRTRLRWRALTSAPLAILQLHLPTELTARVVEELWDRDPAHFRFPVLQAASDPVLRQTMIGLLRGGLAGVPDLYAEAAAEFIAVHALTHHGSLPALREYAGADDRIRHARRFLRENLGRPLSLAAIAAEAGMSRYHFLRVFRDQTGETPHRYLTRLRMEQARQELEHGSANISEVAIECGFPSTQQFSKTFRRETGVSPSNYRKLHRPRRF